MTAGEERSAATERQATIPERILLRLLAVEVTAKRVPRATIGASQNHLYLDPIVSDRLWTALDELEAERGR